MFIASRTKVNAAGETFPDPWLPSPISMVAALLLSRRRPRSPLENQRLRFKELIKSQPVPVNQGVTCSQLVIGKIKVRSFPFFSACRCLRCPSVGNEVSSGSLEQVTSLCASSWAPLAFIVFLTSVFIQ